MEMSGVRQTRNFRTDSLSNVIALITDTPSDWTSLRRYLTKILGAILESQLGKDVTRMASQVTNVLSIAIFLLVLNNIAGWINRRRWSRFLLRTGGGNNPGSWVAEWAKSETVVNAARLDALEKTDRTHNKKNIEVRIMEGSSDEFYPLEPQLDRGVQYKLLFDGAKRAEKAIEGEIAKETEIQAKEGPESIESVTAVSTSSTNDSFGDKYGAKSKPGSANHRFHVWVTQTEYYLEVILNTYGGSYLWPWGGLSAGDRMRLLLAHAREEHCKMRRLETETFRLCQIQKEWVKDFPVPHRLHQKNFIFPDDAEAEAKEMRFMIRDAVEFFNSRQWYRERGIPYRRGYLLHGPQSTGKTFFTRLIAGVIGVPIFVLDISISGFMTNENLPAFLQRVPPKSIVLLKNIDRFVANRSMANVNKDLTFSGLLNVIDGALAHNKGVLMILTTTRYKRLKQDKKSVDALLRPGRVSRSAYFGKPTCLQLQRYFVRMFGSRGKSESEEGTPGIGSEEPHHVHNAANHFIQAMKRCFPQVECIEGSRWRCPLNWTEIKGLLMNPKIQHNLRASSDDKLIQGFISNVRVTKRLKLRKLLSDQIKVLKRELRRPVDDQEDRLERERAVKDALVTLQLLPRPEVGLKTAAELDKAPVIRKSVEGIKLLIKRIEAGEVDTRHVSSNQVKCPTCKGKLVAFPADMYGHYCDGCSSGDCAWRCQSSGCNFDMCANCYAKLAEDI